MTGSETTLPLDLSSALAMDSEAQSIFDNLPLSHQREYIKWIEEAKKAETRTRRIQQTIEQLKKKKNV
ncbi:MAG: YdeI/OmpD-associated family protein [Anaerolineales bacterium]|nr:YdeI/OmpD-associated family protein [Anaerolineales bacterium]MCB9144452.1 YdeI/OmpD-associated family protein [Anaerolineales bacterium]